MFAGPGAAEAQSPPTALLSVNRLGNGSGNMPALNNALSFSSDGRYVAFVSEATDLAANDGNNAPDVFVRDRRTGQTILVSVNTAGTGTGNQGAREPVISANGRYVAFISGSTNLSTDVALARSSDNIYVRDLQAGTTALASVNFAGTGASNALFAWFDPMRLSADGRYLVFTSSATDLVASGDNSDGLDVYVRDLQTRTNTLVSVNRTGTSAGNDNSGAAVITPDGRFIFFMSRATDLVFQPDSGTRRQIYKRDLQTGVTTLVSVNRLGTGGGNGDTDARAEHSMAVSPDGRFVAFVSDANDLVNNDANNAQDVFVRDTQSGVTLLVSANAAGTGTGNGPSGQLAMTPDGRFVTFLSWADNLVANSDTNLEEDIFLRDLQASTTELVSVNLAGAAGGNGVSVSSAALSTFVRPAISADGRYVAFASDAGDLTTANDTNGGEPILSQADVFVRDRQAGLTRPVSVNYSGSDTGRGSSGYSAMTPDGRSIFYFSGARDLVSYDTNGGVQDLFVFANVQQPGQARFKTALTNAGESAGAVDVVVSLGGTAAVPVSIDYVSVGGTATAGADYVAASGTLTFAPGETEKSFSVSLNHDDLDENDETVILRLSGADASPGEPSISVLSIGDDDPAPALTVSDATAAEGDAGTVSALFTISLSAPSGKLITVQVGTQAVTATAGIDYQVISGQLNFSPGQTSRQVAVPIRGDTAVEGTETFFVNLANPTNAVIADGQGVITIIDNDGNDGSVVQLNSAAFTAGEGAGRATVTLTRTGDASQPASVDYRTTDADTFTVGCADAAGAQGKAYARCDFATTVGTVTFAASETSKAITVPVIDDGHAEGNETFQLQLSNPTGAALGTLSAATVTITDNDSAGAPNPVAGPPHEFFVRQQYLDFLSREPDAAGFSAWLGVLNGCQPSADTGPEVASNCDRLFVSGEGFFRSVEFSLKGAYVFRFYRLGFSRLPEYLEIVSDMSFVAGATQAEVFQRRAQLATLFTQRQEFQTLYGGMTNQQYVAALLGRYNLQQVTTRDPANPDAGATVTLSATELAGLARDKALRAVADSDEVNAAEFDNAFVAMQYYGYLRRKPEQSGYDAWLKVLKSGDTRTMVNGFLNSAEYKLRFGQP